MYKPKESNRSHPRISLPLRLVDLSIDAAVQQLTNLDEKAEFNAGRNCRKKKAFREYLSKSLPLTLQQKILDRAVNKLVGVQVSLGLLDMFEPDKVARESVDLLGPFRLGFGCYKKDDRLTWSQGSAKKFNLSIEQCDKLYRILLWSKPGELKELILSISRDALKISKLPNILAQARSLTRITLLSGAENHTLRLLGLNCPSLIYLDISHSIRVSDTGLKNLLLKRPRQRRKLVMSSGDSMEVEEHDSELILSETNPCASKICSITLLGTAVTWRGCQLACKTMNFGYLSSCLPVVKIKRMDPTLLCDKGISFNRKSLSLEPTTQSMSENSRVLIGASIDFALVPEELKDTVIDYYQQPKERGTKSWVFLRNTNSFQLKLAMRMEGNFVTTLILPWYSFTWRLDSLVDLDILGVSFPNLRHLRGRVRGVWNRLQKTFLPNLETAHMWALNSSTGLSILQHAPAIKIFEFNNTATTSEEQVTMELTDEKLEAALTANASLAETLIEFTVRPSVLTANSLRTLIGKCKNLKRVGDLEAWKVSTRDIAEFNKYLDTVNSQCVLTIMNFPPSYHPSYTAMEF